MGFSFAFYFQLIYNRVMKSLSKFLLLSAVCAGMIMSVGCGNKKEYTFYTNMPDSDYKILDKSYKSGGFIEGFTPADTDYEAIDTSAYRQKYDYFYAMATTAQLVVYSDFSTTESEANYSNLSRAVMAKLYAIEKAVSSTVTDSDIYNFNNAAAGAKLEISRIAYEVLTEAKATYEFTDGYYNPALYYNVQAYGFGGAQDFEFPKKTSDLPDNAIIAKYTELSTHFGDILLTEEEGKYFVTKPEYTVEVGGETVSMKLDLGGIGKGYAVDCVDALLDEYGFDFGYFSFGTSSMLVKNNLGNGNFNLGLASPRSNTREPYLSTTIRNEKLSTSGDNENRYFVDGVRYCHIIDPTTGKPVQNGIMSVTVIGGGAAEDDALTTAIMCMGKDRAIQFIEEKLSDRRVIFTYGA